MCSILGGKSHDMGKYWENILTINKRVWCAIYTDKILFWCTILHKFKEKFTLKRDWNKGQKKSSEEHCAVCTLIHSIQLDNNEKLSINNTMKCSSDFCRFSLHNFKEKLWWKLRSTIPSTHALPQLSSNSI